jgi:hypothetical protein
MREAILLHKFLKNSVPEMHTKRRISLVRCLLPLLWGTILTVTELGRNLRSVAKTKHNIKRVDRLLSNTHLYAETEAVYKAMAHYLCGGNRRPVILVDWSDLVDTERTLVIRAAICLQGRAVTIYERAYPLKKYNKPATHKRFLKTLKSILPDETRPIIVTDAGFRKPWFKQVEACGWDWVGRIRKGVNYRPFNSDKWSTVQSLYSKATNIPKSIGLCHLSQKRPYCCYLYLLKKRSLNRKTHRTVHAFRRHAKESGFKKQQRDPWLIATNITPDEFAAPEITKIYSKRMQIEECFRDLKSHRSGFGFNFCLTRKIDRINTLLLMAALASLCLWWIGMAAERQEWQYSFQANTERSRKVLSTLFVAKEVVKRSDLVLSQSDILESFRLFPKLIMEMGQC